MSKRYKEFLIDILTKAYQIILAVVVITPIVTKSATPGLLIGGGLAVLIFVVWAAAIAARLED